MDEALEKLYMPSYWPSRLRDQTGRDDIIKDYLSRCKQGSLMNYERFSTSVTSLRYGEDLNEEIDIIIPEAPNKVPTLFAYIHGGYWQEGWFRDVSMHMASPVVENGYYFAGIGYLCKNKQLSLALVQQQIVKAINFLCSWCEENSIENVVVAGHSAGAHLAATLITCQSTSSSARDVIKGLVLLSGVYELTPLTKTSVNIPDLALKTLTDAEELSPLNLIQQERISLHRLRSVYLSLGEDESPEFHSQSYRFKEKLEKRSIPTIFRVCDAKDHFNLITDLVHSSDMLMQDIIGFLRKITSTDGAFSILN